MDISKQKLIIEQTDRKILPYKALDSVFVPKKGWVHTIRVSLKMSLKQLAKRLNITLQSVKEIEEREENGTITINRLREVGQALDLKLVYGFIPKEQSLEKMIEKRANEVANQIVMQTSQSMMLEDQENSKERIENAIKNKTEELKIKLPNYLWD